MEKYDPEEAFLDLNVFFPNEENGNNSDTDPDESVENRSDAEYEDSSSDDDENEEYPVPLKIGPLDDQMVNFPEPDSFNDIHSRIILECLCALRCGENRFLECPSDKERRMSVMASILAHQQYAITQGSDQHLIQEVPCGSSSPSPIPSSSCKKIYLATRSFDDIQDVLDIIRKFKNTGYLQKISVAILGKPSQLCKSCNDFYLCSLERTADYRFIEENGRVHSISHLRKKGSSQEFCSYRHSTETLLSKANLVICPQEFIISSVLRAKYNITNSSIIFEDGGNIENACYAEASSSVTTDKFILAGECFQSLADCFVEANDAQPSQEFETICQCFSQLARYLQSLAIAINVQARENNSASKEQLLAILNSNGFAPIVIGKYITSVQVALGYIQFHDHIQRLAQNELIEVRLIATIQQFLSSLTYVYKSMSHGQIKDFDLQISKYIPYGEKPANTFKISYVNLAKILEPICDSTSSVIISSACLPPISILREELSSDTTFEEGNDIIIDKQDHTSCFFAYCSTGPNGVPFTLNYKNKDRETIIDETGEAIFRVVQSIPGGVMVFFPSIHALKTKVECWKRRENRLESAWTQFSEFKHIFCELDFMKAEDAKRQLQIFRKFCTKPEEGRSGAIMFALHREKVNELMDFKPGDVRCFISLGIPYNSFVAFTIVTKKLYIESRYPSSQLGDRKNKLWYNAEAFHNQNLKFTHCVRKQQDWFVGLIFDERMAKKVNCNDTELLLPRWMQDKWKEFADFDKLEKRLDRFVREWGLYN